MPRYDDRYGNSTRLYVGHLSSRTRSRDLEHLFSRYGRVRDVDMKQDFAFVDFSDPRDADEAIYNLHGRDLDGRRIVVEFAKGVPRGPGGVRDSIGRGPTPGTGRCFNCGIDGHWARDCTSGDWKNKCYRCGERGHVERNCKSSPKKKPSRGRSYSRSPVRSRSPRRGGGRGRSYSRSPSRSYSRGRSYSRSRSPVKRKPVEREDRRPRSRSYSRSPDVKKEAASISKSRKRSLTPDEVNEIRGKSRSPEGLNKDQHEETRSPGRRSESPVMEEKGSPAGRRYDDSPFEANGNSRSPSPRAKRSPAEDVEEQRTPRGSESS